jgi:hypothetical protein
MYLVMREADTNYDKTMFELSRLDDESSKEQIILCAYPNYLNNSEMKLMIKNRCELGVKIVRVWINDTYETLDAKVDAMADKEIGPIIVVPYNGSYYDISVTTERGNIFTSQTGSLLYSNGIWYTPELSVSVHILNNQGQYRIIVENTTHVLKDWESNGIIHYDFTETFEVYNPGTYKVTIKEKVGGTYRELAASPIYATIDWPYGPPIVFVFADGRQLK